MKYNTKLINQVIRDFQQHAYRPQEVTIYFDLDNTLALFSPYGDPDSLRKMWHKGFYRNLPCFREVPYVLNELKNQGFNIKILSSCINSPYCVTEKIEWVLNHLPFIPPEDIVLVPEGEDKIAYIPTPKRSILVDDFYKNITGIYRVGGVGIKKTFSNKERPIPQVSNLMGIFSILQQLNIKK